MLEATMTHPEVRDPYLQNEVLTASREELILMLFNGALKFCHQAEALLGQGDWALAGKCLVRAQRVVHYLSLCLDLKAGGEIAKNLEALYEYLNRRLSQAYITRDPEPLRETVGILQGLRDAWDEGVVRRPVEAQ